MALVDALIWDCASLIRGLPILSVGRDRLFQALGRTYSMEFCFLFLFAPVFIRVKASQKLLKYDICFTFLVGIKLEKSSRICASSSESSSMMWYVEIAIDMNWVREMLNYLSFLIFISDWFLFGFMWNQTTEKGGNHTKREAFGWRRSVWRWGSDLQNWSSS